VEVEDGGTYYIKLKSNAKTWHAHNLGDDLVSTRHQTTGRFSQFTFFLNPKEADEDPDTWSIRVAADGRRIGVDERGCQLLTTRHEAGSIFHPWFDAFSLSEQELDGAYNISVTATGNILHCDAYTENDKLLTTMKNNFSEASEVYLVKVDDSTLEDEGFTTGTWVRFSGAKNVVGMDDNYDLVEMGILLVDEGPMVKVPTAPEVVFKRAATRAQSMPECIAFGIHSDLGVQYYSEECQDEDGLLRTEGVEGWTTYLEEQHIGIAGTNITAPKINWAPSKVGDDPALKAEADAKLSHAESRNAWASAFHDYKESKAKVKLHAGTK